ncbi:hypothetical protein [Clostridium butyricum]
MVDLNDIKNNLRIIKITIITTGSQGEPMGSTYKNSFREIKKYSNRKEIW